MALTVEQAKELAKTATITITESWADSISLMFGGKVEANLELRLNIKNIANVFFDIIVPSQKLNEITIDSITVYSEPTPIINCAMIEASAEEIDTTRFRLGYSNGYDTPETMEKWITQPDKFLLSLVDYVPLIKDLIHKEVLAKFKLDLNYKSQLLTSRTGF